MLALPLLQVRLATDNERETRGWVEAMQSMDSPRAAGAAAGGLGAPPEGSGLKPNLSGKRTKGFDGHAKPRGRASVAHAAGDPSALLREALLLFLPAADVTAVSQSVSASCSFLARWCSPAGSGTAVWARPDGWRACRREGRICWPRRATQHRSATRP